MERSLRARRLIATESAHTIADGIAVRVPIAEALDYLAGVVDDVVLVGDEALRAAMRLVRDTRGILAEPAGAAGVAALNEHAGLRDLGLVGTPICGSNG